MAPPVEVSAEDKQRYLEVALAAAKEAGAAIAAAWDGARRVELKGAVDLVTETDKACEAMVLSRIRAAFPDHAFIGEEGSAEAGFTAALGPGPTWMVDPVDGTTNFVHRFPFSCVSIGLVVGRRPVVGVVFNPVLGELFSAVEGGGAFLNGAPIAVSPTSHLGSAVFATELGTRRDDAFMEAAFGRMRALGQATRGMRCCGSAALNLCGVAMGRLDAYYEVGLGGPWDMAAAVCILREAGGEVLDPAGGPFNLMSRRVLGANAHLGAGVAAVLAAAPWAADEPPAVPPPE
jgi:inositol-phosphate phosphatase/L-galactose 1-phosphate phosphatase